MSETAVASFKPFSRPQMAQRAADDIPEGWYVNLGIGIPTLIADFVPMEREVIFHSENGVLGMGPAPEKDKIEPWLINAGKQYVTLRAGGSFCHHADSFSMIRGGHLDLCVLGAFQVADNGDIANWATSENDTAPAVGGAMDLAAGAKRLVGADGAHHQGRHAEAGDQMQLSADRARRGQAHLYESGDDRCDGSWVCRAGHGAGPEVRGFAGADGCETASACLNGDDDGGSGGWGRKPADDP